MKNVNESRLISIPNLREWYPELDFSGLSELSIDDHSMFVTDPTYLADIFNPNDDANASYLRRNAVIISDFGGEAVTPVWWKPPFLVVPTSHHDQQLSDDAIELAEEIGCDSASFVFVAMNDNVPRSLRAKIAEVENLQNGVRLKLPEGTYRFYFEQFEPTEEHKQWPQWYRNIVAKRVVSFNPPSPARMGLQP